MQQTTTPDNTLANLEYEALMRFDSHIPAEQCKPGLAYWGNGRVFDDVVICDGVNDSGETEFSYLSNHSGKDLIQHDIHHDDDSNSGVFMPYIELVEVPDFEDELSMMQWLLDIRIETTQAKVDLLKNMPERLKRADSYRHDLGLAEVRLGGLLGKAMIGLSQQCGPTTAEILEAKLPGRY